jgi:hypothetical protein
LQSGKEREIQEGTSWFLFLVTSLRNGKEVTSKTGTPSARDAVALCEAGYEVVKKLVIPHPSGYEVAKTLATPKNPPPKEPPPWTLAFFLNK